MTSASYSRERTPAVAVLMCVYQSDQPSWLAEALDSVLGQTYPANSTHIYLGIDGPIPAALQEQIDQRRPKLYKVSASAERQGLARGLNRLIEMLEDESYVFRMDSDDVCLPDRFAAQVSYLELHPHIAILGAAIEEMDAQGRSLGVRTYPNAAAVKATMARASPLAHPTVCMRTGVLKELGGYPCTGTNEDIALWFKACHEGHLIDNIPTPLLRYRITRATYGRRGARKAGGELRVYVNGILHLHGLSWRLMYPVLRYLLRLMPSPITHLAYRSAGFRNWLTKAE